MKKEVLKLLCFLPALLCMNGLTQTTYNTPEMIYYKFDASGLDSVQNQANPGVGANYAQLIGGMTQSGTGQFLTALEGTGVASTTDFVDTEWATNLSGSWTISFWLDMDEPANTRYLFGDSDANSFRCFAGGVAPNNGILVRGTGWTNLDIPDVLGTFGPSVIHIVYDDAAGVSEAYVNGVLVNSVNQGTGVTFTGTNFGVGAYGGSTSGSLEGAMDEFRLYNRAVDANEIGLTYNQELPFTVVCGVPQNFTESNLSANSVDISWDHGSGNDNYEIEYGPAGFTPGTGTVISGPITGASITENITGLAPNTTYDYYITEDCNGGGDQLTFGPFTFTTDCGVEVAPFTENFDGTTWVSGTGASNTGDAINPCWARNPGIDFFFGTRSGTTSSTTTGPSDDFTGGGKYVFTEGSSGATGDVALITSPEIDLSTLTNPYMTFYYHMYGADVTSLEVEISNDGGLTWTTESSIVGEQQTNNSDAWMEQPVNLAAYVGDVIQFRFSTSRGGSYNCDVAIDEVEIDEAPTCPKPTDFMATSITDVTIGLSWVNGGSESMWNIEYGPPGFTQGNGTFLSTTTNPDTLTGLTPETVYDIYIQADCGGGDESDWVGPITVETECGAFTAPYLESFDIGSLPNCWTNTSSNTGSANTLWKFTGNPGYGATNNGRPAGTFAWTDGSTPIASDITLISPLVDMSALTVPMLSFDWYSYNEDNPGDNVPLIVDINDGSGWTNLLTLSGDDINWQEAEITLSAYIGQTVQFRFITDQTIPTVNAFYNDILLDSVLVDEAPSCPKPTPIDVTNIMATSADIDWTAGYLESEWIVEYGPTGFLLGTGDTLVTSNLSDTTLNGLSPNTGYDVYVRAICAPGDTSEYRGPSSFTTPCVDYIAPFYENFDSSLEWVSGTGFNNNGDTISQCWSRNPVQSTSGAFWGTRTETTGGASTGPDTDFSGTGNYMYFESSYGSAGDSAELITPNIDMSNIDNPILTFYYHMYGSTMGTLQVEVSNNGGITWDSLYAEVGEQQTAGNDPWEKVTVELYDYEDENVLIRFLGIKNGTNGDLAIDEISVYPCIPAQGQDGNEDICRLDQLFDLNSSIVKGQENGTWSFAANNNLIVNDTLFDVSLLPSGSYDVHYIVPGGCDDDTTFATVNVFPPSSAGQGGSLEVCLNEPISLYSGLSGSVDIGGTWYDPSGNLINGAQPNAPNIPGNYNYDYIVSNGVCPADTSLLVVIVDGTCDYLSIGEEQLAEVVVYPNPVTDVVNISTPSNSGALRIQMFDVNGRVVISDANALANVSDAAINIEHLQKGVYTLRIYNEDGQRTFRIVKQ